MRQCGFREFFVESTGFDGGRELLAMPSVVEVAVVLVCGATSATHSFGVKIKNLPPILAELCPLTRNVNVTYEASMVGAYTKDPSQVLDPQVS